MAACSGIVGVILAASLAWATEDPPSEAAAEARSGTEPVPEAILALVDSGRHPDLAWSDFTEDRDAVRRFYVTRGWRPAWIRDSAPTPQARDVAVALERAAEVGLDPRDYDGWLWGSWVSAPETAAPPSDRARVDVGLTVSAVRFVSDLHAGRIRHDRVAARMGRVHVAREEEGFDAAALIGRLATTDDVTWVLASVQPPFETYRRTLEALQRYLALAPREAAEPLPVPARPVAAGARFAGAARLARRLQLLGDLEAEAPVPEAVLDPALSDAVARFQRRHGLDATGSLDRRTVRALNVPLSRRAEQLALTLERWRWLPHRFAAPPIVVNIPEFRLHVADPARHFSMKVVVGRAYRHRTPLFAAEMTRVVFRPHWNVPLDIQLHEIVPELEKDPGHLASGSYDVVERGGTVVEGTPTPELLERLRAGSLRLRQRAGPRNALGLVQFVFPNPYRIYLHDTPVPELFARSRRDFSHGCIRVEDPVALAAWVLRDEPSWTVTRIRAAMAGEETLRVGLSHPVTVLVLYGTAVVAENGEVRFFEDLYGGDAALGRALADERTRRGAPSP